MEQDTGINLEELADALDAHIASTAAQRHALYAMGRSKYFVRKYAATRTDASRAIAAALKERRQIEEQKRK